ncbi:MAG: YgfZ/GcvT domain-containing protein [Pleurocapsa sp.]
MKNLRQSQQAAGAILDAESNMVLSFNNETEALNAVEDGVVLCDRASWGLLKFTGEDRLRYLHNQSTNDFERLQSGQGCDTVFVTSTARTLDLATAYVTDDAVLVIVSPNRRQQLFQWLDKFIFPFDKVKLKDISTEYIVFSLIGSQSDALLSQLAPEAEIGEEYGDHSLVNIDNVSLRIARGSGLASPGYTLIIPTDSGAAFWSKLTTMGAIPTGDRFWSNLSIQQGRPTPDRELTEDYNPLEAGLWHTISFEKGCYIGQETIARLNTYKGVKQRLWGVKLSQKVTPPTPVILDNKKVGVLTSYTDTPNGSFGLAYVRTIAGGVGLSVKVGDATGQLVSVPFVRHQE